MSRPSLVTIPHIPHCRSRTLFSLAISSRLRVLSPQGLFRTRPSTHTRATIPCLPAFRDNPHAHKRPAPLPTGWLLLRPALRNSRVDHANQPTAVFLSFLSPTPLGRNRPIIRI